MHEQCFDLPPPISKHQKTSADPRHWWIAPLRCRRRRRTGQTSLSRASERAKRNSIRPNVRSIDGPGAAVFVEFHVLYRVLRWITTWYPLAVLWLCIAAMIVAFSLMFVFPPGTLLLLFLGLAGLGAAVIGFRVLQGMQRRLARRCMAHGI